MRNIHNLIIHNQWSRYLRVWDLDLLLKTNKHMKTWTSATTKPLLMSSGNNSIVFVVLCQPYDYRIWDRKQKTNSEYVSSDSECVPTIFIIRFPTRYDEIGPESIRTNLDWWLLSTLFSTSWQQLIIWDHTCRNIHSGDILNRKQTVRTLIH